jgi:hypothetical protein
MRHRLWTLAASAICLLAAAGCGTRDLPRYAVTGTVTFEGEPVPKGDVQLLPLAAPRGPDATRITAGQFATRSIAGKHRVEIRALRPLPGGQLDGFGLPATEAYIPARYNESSELEVEVTPAGPNDFRFDLMGQRR